MSADVIIQSKNQKSMFEQYQNTIQRALNIRILLVMALIFAFAFFPNIYNQQVRYQAYRVKEFSFSIKMVIIICGGTGLFFITSYLREAIKEFEQYKNLCEKEYLIVDSEKVSGETSDGDFKLLYNQILHSQLQHETIPKDKRIKQTDIIILTITDIAGNEFVFKTFANSKELKHFIDEGIEKV